MRGGRRQHRRSMSASLCSPFPASPYAFAPGSKIFTFPPPDLSSLGPRQAASLCSPLPVSPYAFVSGSKIFTFPPPDFALSGARRPPLFAPRSPLALVAPFRGAKSSHFSRRFSPSPAPGGRLSLLPAIPYSFVSGSKIFTFPPPDFALSGARRPLLFAPLSPLSLVASFRGAKSSHFCRRI